MAIQMDTMTTSDGAATTQTSEHIKDRVAALRDKIKAFHDHARGDEPKCLGCDKPYLEKKLLEWSKPFLMPDCECVERLEQHMKDLDAEWSSCKQRESVARRAAEKIAANNPGRFSDASIDTWPAREDQPTAFKAIKAFMKLVLGGEAKALVMMGGVGCGKTHLAYGAANDLIMLGRDVKVIKVGNWIRQINMSYSSGSDIEKTLIEPVFDAEVLVLDDLGKESITDATRRVLYELLDHRWQQQLPTIVTTNFEGPKQLTEHYSDDAVMQGAISSRLLGLAGKFVVQMRGEKDHRWQ